MSSLQQSRLLKVKWNSRWQGNDSTKILKNSIFYKFYCMINLSQIKRFGVYQNWLNSRGFSRHTDIARREKKAYVDFCQSNFLSNYMTYNQGIKFCSQAFIHTHTHTPTVPPSSWEERTSFTSQILANLGLQFALTTSTIESCFHKKVGLCSHQTGYCPAGCKMKIGKDY
jgi:hypothetical protein